MAFPSSPTNAQTATVNGITYQYNSTTNAWKRTTVTLSVFPTYDFGLVGSSVTVSQDLGSPTSI